MNTPRSGLRRAAVAAWVLAGVGAAGVAGTSKLVYAETLQSAAEQTLTTVQSGVQNPVPDPVLVPLDPDTAEAAPRTPPEVVPQPVSEVPPAPVRQTPAYTPAPAYSAPPASAPAPEYTSPAPALHPNPTAVMQAPPPSSTQGGFPIRKSHSPMGGGSASGGNKVTPSHTASHGS